MANTVVQGLPRQHPDIIRRPLAAAIGALNRQVTPFAGRLANRHLHIDNHIRQTDTAIACAIKRHGCAGIGIVLASIGKLICPQTKAGTIRISAAAPNIPVVGRTHFIQSIPHAFKFFIRQRACLPLAFLSFYR